MDASGLRFESIDCYDEHETTAGKALSLRAIPMLRNLRKRQVEVSNYPEALGFAPCTPSAHVGLVRESALVTVARSQEFRLASVVPQVMKVGLEGT